MYGAKKLDLSQIEQQYYLFTVMCHKNGAGEGLLVATIVVSGEA